MAHDMSSEMRLQAEGVVKRFQKREVLHGLDIRLHSAECVLLSGANGAGKSTLLRILAGLERPDKGRFDMGRGMRSWRWSRQELLDSIVYLHQQAYMLDGSVTRNLAYALPKGLDKAASRRRVEEALHWSDLHHLADAYAKNLSGGERQRVALARAWVRGAPVLMLDEPTANMDNASRSRTVSLLSALKESGRTLLIASHDPGHLFGLVDRGLHMEDGSLDVYDISDDKVTPIEKLRGQGKTL